MNIPKYSLENQKVVYFFLAILLIGGVISFFKLPKKEDAPFVIKTAVLVTQYPGANPHEVEKFVQIVYVCQTACLYSKHLYHSPS